MGYVIYLSIVAEIAYFIANYPGINGDFTYAIGYGSYLAGASFIWGIITGIAMCCSMRSFKKVRNMSDDEEPIMSQA
jgi:hypothetical protein